MEVLMRWSIIRSHSIHSTREKVFDINVSGLRCGLLCIAHCCTAVIVFKKDGRGARADACARSGRYNIIGI